MNDIITTPGITEVPSVSTAPSPEQLVAVDSQKDFAQNRTHFQQLVNDWEKIRDRATEHRKTRDVELSVETLRREGTLDEDETIIPVRVIDTNITREQPPFINYIKNSRRVCIFSCLSNPDLMTDKLELEFTRGMTYPSWENVHFKTLDGAATHGWDAVEVVFDASKPFNVCPEHVGYDKLFWPQTCKDIQQASRVIREYDFTIIELRRFVSEYGWSAAQVNKVINARKSGKKDAETCKIYKVLFKEDGVVFSGWFSLEDGCDDWLFAPSEHYIGIDKKSTDPLTGAVTWTPVPLTEYPIFILPYRESEKPKLVDKKGRVFLDNPKQEAQTSVLSGYVNGLNRASRVLASPKQDDGTGNSVKELADTVLAGGTILNKPIDFYNPPYPDPQCLKALQYMDSFNSNETSQVNFAVMNREDSRKTAKEVSLAEQQAGLLNSVQLTLFSTFVRQVYGLCWLVVQSQALQDSIKFLMVKVQVPQINPLTGAPVVDPSTGQPVVQEQWTNDFATVEQLYELRAAGDVDVIQKNERVMQMKQDWPVIQNTSLSIRFLTDLIRLSYPDKGDEYAKILEEGQQNEVKSLGGLVVGFSKVVESLLHSNPEVFTSLTPENQQALEQMLTMSKQVEAKGQQQ